MTNIAKHLLTLALTLSTIFSVSGCAEETETDDAVEIESTEQALTTGWKWIGWDTAGVYHQSDELCQFRQVDTVRYGKWVYHTGNTRPRCAPGGDMCSAHYDGKAGWIRCSALR